jgi:hypothetical protein
MSETSTESTPEDKARQLLNKAVADWLDSNPVLAAWVAAAGVPSVAQIQAQLNPAGSDSTGPGVTAGASPGTTTPVPAVTPGKAAVMGHGTFSSEKTFVPQGTTLYFYTEDETYVLTAEMLRRIIKNKPFDHIAPGKPVSNYRLEGEPDGKQVKILQEAGAIIGETYILGGDLAADRLCDDPKRCQQYAEQNDAWLHAPACQGVLGLVRFEEVHLPICRVKFQQHEEYLRVKEKQKRGEPLSPEERKLAEDQQADAHERSRDRLKASGKANLAQLEEIQQRFLALESIAIKRIFWHSWPRGQQMSLYQYKTLAEEVRKVTYGDFGAHIGNLASEKDAFDFYEKLGPDAQQRVRTGDPSFDAWLRTFYGMADHKKKLDELSNIAGSLSNAAQAFASHWPAQHTVSRRPTPGYPSEDNDDDWDEPPGGKDKKASDPAGPPGTEQQQMDPAQLTKINLMTVALHDAVTKCVESLTANYATAFLASRQAILDKCGSLADGLDAVKIGQADQEGQQIRESLLEATTKLQGLLR